MQYNEIEKHLDFLLALTLRKCGNLDDARDLAQDTLVAALSYLSDGKGITNLKAFLSGVANRKFNDYLRKKYKLPTVCFETVPEIETGTNDFDMLYCSDEAERLRKQIAFLSKKFREIIVRHYFNGDSVEKIGRELDIPKGTVKSRLFEGREHIRKGFDIMEHYSEQSYDPKVLYVSISGTQGFNGEPSSLTNNNLIAQNLLILAYEEPASETELAKAIAIPAAYIEPVIDELVRNELMKRVGGKVYTDFIIYTPEDTEKAIPSQERLINNNFDTLWPHMQSALDKLRKANYYINQEERAKQKLEYYFLMFSLSKCFFGTGSKIYDNTQHYPKRPNGGEWIASAFSYPKNYNYSNSLFNKYSWSGERINRINDTLGVKELMFRVFDTPLEKKRYYHTRHNLGDDGIAQMLYITNKGIEPNSTGIDPLFFYNIPHLAECGAFRIENGKPAVDIPLLSKAEYDHMCKITWDTANMFIPDFLPLLSDHLKNSKSRIPKHLTSVPEQKLYLRAMDSLHMLMIYNAKDRDLILEDVDYPCPPMILIIDK